MPLKVFLSYSTDPEENAIVWRLQTLAAASGIQLFVPQRTSSRTPSGRKNVPILADDVRLAIDQSDYVLALITKGMSPAVEKELNFALGRGKLILPIVEQGVEDHTFLKKFNPVFWFSRLEVNPGRVETEVVQYLKKQEQDKQTRQALGALVAIGMGLLLLSSLAKE